MNDPCARHRHQYVIRFLPAAPAIQCAQWAVWRPGDYYTRGRGWKIWQSTSTWQEALKKIEEEETWE